MKECVGLLISILIMNNCAYAGCNVSLDYRQLTVAKNNAERPRDILTRYPVGNIGMISEIKGIVLYDAKIGLVSMVGLARGANYSQSLAFGQAFGELYIICQRSDAVLANRILNEVLKTNNSSLKSSFYETANNQLNEISSDPIHIEKNRNKGIIGDPFSPLKLNDPFRLPRVN